MGDVGQAIGTIAGGVIGFMIGGPAGAARGAALGYSLTSPRPEMPDNSPTYNFGQAYNTKSQQLPVPIVYGKNKVAGNDIFEDVTGEDDENIFMQVAVSEGPIQSITEIKANDVDVTGDSTVKWGTRTQSADNRNEYNQHFPYTAYVSVELEASEDLSGSPTITSIVEGRKVDVWNGTSWVNQYSHNPAYCILDFITNTRYGLGIDESQIDLDSFKAVGDYCDETVDGEPRFQLDYVLDTQRSSLDYLKDMLSTFRGFLVYSAGEIRLKVDAPDTAVQSFDMGNIIQDSFGYSKTSKKERYNQFTVEYIEPDNHWEQIGARASIDSDILTNGINEESIKLLGINRFSQAGRMAKYYMKKSLYCTTYCQFGAGIDSIQCEVGDVITVSHDVPGWTDKKFRIIEMREQENDEMQITAEEYNEAVYSDDGVVQQVKKESDLPNPFEPPASVTNLSLVEEAEVLKDGTWNPGIKVTFTRPDYIVWDSANIYISSDDGATWDFITNVTDTEYTIKQLPPDTYKVKVVSKSKKGRTEDFGTANTGSITVVGKDANPTDVNWGTCTFKEQIILRWQPITDVDLKAYEIRTDTNFGNDDSALIYRGDGLQATIDNPQQRTYTFYIKALDRSGNYSSNANSKTVNNPAPSAPTLTGDHITEFAYALWIEIPEVTDEDLQGYKVYITPSDGAGNPAGTTEIIPVTTAQKITYQADAGQSFLIKIGTYDSLTSLMSDENISSAYEATAMNTQIPDQYIDQNKLGNTLAEKINIAKEQGGSNAGYTFGSLAANNTDISDKPANEVNNPCNSLNAQLSIQNGRIQTAVQDADESLSLVTQLADEWSVKIQSHANGEDIISGIGLLNDTDGNYSEFAVLADRFKVYGNPDDPSEDAQTVFALDTQTNSLYLLGDLIADGTITARMLSSAELITDSAQIRDAIITDAKIQSLGADKIDAGEIVADLIISNGSLSAMGGNFDLDENGLYINTQDFTLDKQGNMSVRELTYDELNVNYASAYDVSWFENWSIVQSASSINDLNTIRVDWGSLQSDTSYFLTIYHNDLSVLNGLPVFDANADSTGTDFFIYQMFNDNYTMSISNFGSIAIGVVSVRPGQIDFGIKRMTTGSSDRFYLHFKRQAIS